MKQHRFPYVRQWLRLIRDRRGSAVIETAIVAPALVLMTLGTYDVSHMIARQHELQAGTTDLEGVILAVAEGQGTDVQKIKEVLVSSLDLPSSKVSVTKVFRCNHNSTLVTSASSCGESDVVSTYVKVTLTDSYSPSWTNFGIGHAVNYRLVRTMQVS